ncbi:MAG TPA: LysR substrate-binding domain-containing protein [Usitatibacter sp.]|jgi:DNA-binding transcriptional LysR family regulator|nr:LysR substrate-binding domain-containing protein [Usitatibacter sp.]
MRPDITSLALFIRVAELKSITKAANASHIALAAASRRIAQLEDGLGVHLLFRSARGVELTPAGTALLQHARDIMARLDSMRVELSDYAKGGKGLVRVQANASALAQYLPADLATFFTAHPLIKLSLEEERSSAIVEALHAGATDVGIVMEGAESSGLQMFDYRTDVLCAVVPKKHAIRGRKVAFAELLDQDFVGLENNTVISQLMLAEAHAREVPLKLRVEVKSFDVVARMIQAGLGIGVLPEAAATAFAGPMSLRLLALTDAWAQRRMFVAVRQYASLAAPARLLVDHLVPSR